MKPDKLQQFVKLHHSLHAERTSLHQRLDQINSALGNIQLPSLSVVDGATSSRKERAGTARRRMSAAARARIAAAARKRWAKAKRAGRNRL